MNQAACGAAIDYRRMAEPAGGFAGGPLPHFSAATGGRLSGATDQRPAPAVETAGWVEDYLGRDASRFFYKWGGSLSAVMTRLRARYDGDLDQFLLHLVFMLTDLASANAASDARAAGARTVIIRRRGLNVLSLADITRIPRETVRRKLAALTDRGLVVREDDGLYYPGPASDIDQFFYALSPLFWDGVKPT